MNAETTTSGAPSWTLKVDADEIAWLEFDKPGSSTNVLSSGVMLELGQRMTEIAARRPRAVIVTSAKESGFIAGADIKEFTELTTPEQAYQLVSAGQQVLARLEALPCPTVAAINGFALGGGLELALACRYRVAINDPKLSLALPEVQLGIHPGFGGTVRAVRVLGPVAALDLMLTGRAVRADKALKIGLVDRLVSSTELRSAAREIALRAPPPHRPALPARLLNLAPLRPFVANKTRQKLAAHAAKAHHPAPYAIVDLWQRHGARTPAAYEAEARSIAELFCTSTSRNLVRVFLLQDRLKALGSGKHAQKASAVHVVGAGVMGGDIASWCAHRGLQVSLQDRAMEFVAPALERARGFFSKRYRDERERDQALDRLKADVAGERAGAADVIVEAIYENADAKRELYARLESAMKPGAILATNTSSIVLEKLAEGLQDPGRFVGLHFFNPVARMPLIEIIQAEFTRPEVLQAAMVFARQLDKLPLPCRSAPGFVVNRILMPYLNEAMLAAEQGVPYPVLDKTATDFGMPMGPIELIDVIGLDIAQHVGRILAQAFSRPAAQSLQRLIADKRLGKKSGKGFYEWRDGKPEKPIVSMTAPADLEDRLILPLVNESMAVLREGIAADADLVDAGVIFGTGFAPFRGGPLHYARARGVRQVVSRLEELAQKYGPHFRPDPGWQNFI